MLLMATLLLERFGAAASRAAAIVGLNALALSSVWAICVVAGINASRLD